MESLPVTEDQPKLPRLVVKEANRGEDVEITLGGVDIKPGLQRLEVAVTGDGVFMNLVTAVDLTEMDFVVDHVTKINETVPEFIPGEFERLVANAPMSRPIGEVIVEHISKVLDRVQ